MHRATEEATTTSMHSPPVGTEAHPKLWLQMCQKDINVFGAKLRGIIGKILVQPEEDTTFLTNTSTIHGPLSELHFEAGG